MDAPARTLWAFNPAVRRAWLALTLYNTVLGIVLLAGGPNRIMGPSFVAIRDLGGHIAWGSALVLIGILLAAGGILSRRVLTIAFASAGAIHLFLALCFAAAIPQTAIAALTGVPTYFAVAFWHLSQSEIYRSGET